MTKQIVLKLIREHTEEFLSGEAISRQAGVSRAAVWKAVEQLRQEGYGIESVPNRGYRLTRVTARLRPEELSEQFRDRRIGRELLCFDTIDSTNTEAKRQAMAGAREGLVVLAEEQTGGRGRLGRSFQSPRGCGLYLTALLRPQLPPIEVVDFTAWVAVAVCDGIQAACGVRPRIKWTNDIVLEGKKLCGILTEMGLENEINALQYLVTGIGVNVNQRPEDFSPDVRPIAASLFNVLGRPVRRSELAVQIIRALDRMYSAFPQGKADYLARYRADCLTPGNRVQLITPASRTEATALSIDDEFRLVVEYDDGRREALSAGEVSVRGMYGYV